MDLYSSLRPPLKRWAAGAQLKRVKSSPPAFTRRAGERHLSLWVQQSSRGYDSMLGGVFTVNLQLGTSQGIGTHAVAGSDALVTERAPSTWGEATAKRALELHNRVVRKRKRPPAGVPHFLANIMSAERIEQTYYRPLEALNVRADYWMPFLDAEDGAAWGELLAETLTQSFETFPAERDWPSPWR
jgi:hypothetical protein